MIEKIAKLIWLASMTALITGAIILFQKSYNKIEVPEPVPVEQIVDKKEVACVRQALWHEARGEGEHGLKAVLSVIVNRVNSPGYPDSFCEVIHQPKQFSYVHELQAQGKSLKPIVTESNKKVYERIDQLAHQAVKGKFKSIFDRSVLWYHTHAVKPSWSKKKKIVAMIGNHRFFAKKQQSEG